MAVASLSKILPVAPTVSITGGGGSGASATVSIVGAVTSISCSNPGSGYTDIPSVTIASATSSNTASAHAVMQVASISIISAGSNYNTSSTTVTIGAPSAAGVTAVAGTVSFGTGGTITGIQVASGGTSYTTRPSITITDPTSSGSGAVASAALNVLALPVTDQGLGLGYQTGTAYAVTISGGGGSGAAGSALVQGVVESIALTAGGSNYTSAPSVTIASPTISPTSTASFIPVIAADGGTNFFPNPTTSGAWTRINDWG
jgi:hypothetical protein